jgi:hypothetical protein
VFTLGQELLPSEIRCCAPGLHETTRPSTELSLVALVLACRTFNQVPHSQDGPVGHANLRLEVRQRFCHPSLIAEGVSRANPRTQWHPQTLKWRAHRYTELPPAGLALKETLAVALLLPADPEDL